MILGEVKPGYIGIASVNGSTVRCTDMNINPSQEPLFYDHILGLRDSFSGGIFGGKGDNGSLNPQKTIWRPGVKIAKGSIGFPATTYNSDLLFDNAKRGSDLSSVALFHSCGLGLSFSSCKVNTYSVTATAGDIVNISAEIIGISSSKQSSSTTYTTPEKLVTWDKVSCSISGGNNDWIQSFNITINNNCIPVYTAGANNSGNKLEALEIRVGMQEVSGSITYYNDGNWDLSFLDSQEPVALMFSAHNLSINANVLLQPLNITGSVTPVISTMAFKGQGRALGA